MLKQLTSRSENLRHGKEHIWIILYTLQYVEEIIENLFESSFNNLIAGRYHNLETKMCSIVKKTLKTSAQYVPVKYTNSMIVENTITIF